MGEISQPDFSLHLFSRPVAVFFWVDVDQSHRLLQCPRWSVGGSSRKRWEPVSQQWMAVVRQLELALSRWILQRRRPTVVTRAVSWLYPLSALGPAVTMVSSIAVQVVPRHLDRNGSGDVGAVVTNNSTLTIILRAVAWLRTSQLMVSASDLWSIKPSALTVMIRTLAVACHRQHPRRRRPLHFMTPPVGMLFSLVASDIRRPTAAALDGEIIGMVRHVTVKAGRR